MFATYHSHSMLPAAPADAPFLGYATPGAMQNERLTFKMPVKETLVQARPKVGLRASNIAYAPASEQTAIPVYTGPAEFVVPLSASAPQPASATPTSPPRAYGRPRRLPLSVRHGRRVSATPTSPSGSSKPSSAPASRTMTFESITCTPQLHSTSFEELRVECYRVSYLATGHAPMPVTPESATWDTIPPFYSPFVQEGPEVDGVGSGVSDVTMSENSDSGSQFAFAFHSTMAFPDPGSSVSVAGDTHMEY